jgi:hypothetical protein
VVELRGFEPLASCMPCHPRPLTPLSPALPGTSSPLRQALAGRWCCAGSPPAWARPAASSAASTATCTYRSAGRAGRHHQPCHTEQGGCRLITLGPPPKAHGEWDNLRPEPNPHNGWPLPLRPTHSSKSSEDSDAPRVPTLEWQPPYGSKWPLAAATGHRRRPCSGRSQCAGFLSCRVCCGKEAGPRHSAGLTGW